jgi:septal ring factor EnvC (AmiA/AmiB activator)
MKQIKAIGVGIGIVAVLAISGYYIYSSNFLKCFLSKDPMNDTSIKEYQHTIDSLQKVMVNNEQLLTESRVRVAMLNDSINILATRIDSSQNKLATIKKEYNEKIKSIRDFSSNDIERFITDRYK